MKKKFYLFAIIFCVSFIFMSCDWGKNDEYGEIIIDTTNVNAELEYGEDLDLSELIVKGKKGGTTFTIGNATDAGYSIDLGGFDKYTSGTYTITIEYKNYKKATFTVVVGLELKDIEIVGDFRRDYILNESLDLTGAKVKLYYSDGSTITQDLDLSKIIIGGFSFTTSGTKQIEVSFLNKQYIVEVNVHNVGLESITVVPPAKTTYKLKEDLSLDGGKVILNYWDIPEDCPREIIPTEFPLDSEKITISGFDNQTKGNKNISVWYQDKSAKFTVEVKAPIVTGIVVKPPVKTEYRILEELSLQGGYIDISYDYIVSGERLPGRLDLTNPDVIIDSREFDNEVGGVHTIIVKYENAQATFDVYVDAPKLTGIKLEGEAITNYKLGQELELSGLTLVMEYSYGPYHFIDLGQDFSSLDIEVLGFDNTICGNQEIVISSQGMQVSYYIQVKAPLITSVRVTAPSKTEYRENEELLYDGGFIDIIYNYEVVNSDYPTRLPLSDSRVVIDDSDFDTTCGGTYTIKVDYCGFEDYFDIIYIEKLIQDISLIGQPKAVYYLGEQLDLSNTSLFVIFNYGDDVIIDLSGDYPSFGISITGFDSTTICQSRPVYVEYGGKQVSFNIKVIEPSVSKIVVYEPTKVHYEIGNQLSLVGGYITIKYSLHESEQYLPTRLMLTDTRVNINDDDFDNTKVGTYVIVVSYKGVSKGFSVTVSEPTLSSLQLVGTPKSTYNLGEELDVSNLSLNAVFTNSQNETISLAGDYSSRGVTIYGYDSNRAGNQTIVVGYELKEVTFDVCVISPSIESIIVTVKKVNYYEGENLLLEGGYIDIVYSYDVSEEYLPKRLLLTDESISVNSNEFDNTKGGEYTIYVEYSNKQTSFNVFVIQREVTQVYLSKTPKKMYKLGEDFDYSSLSLQIVYNYGNDTILQATATYEELGITLHGFDTSTSGQKTITITYENKTIEFNINVKAPDVTGIVVTKPTKTIYQINETMLSYIGGKIDIFYSYEVSEEYLPNTLPLSDRRITKDASNVDTSTSGIYDVIVTYCGKSDRYTVTVSQSELKGISISGTPKTMYNLGENLDLSNISLTLIYTYGSNETLALTKDYQRLGVTATGFSSSSTGVKQVTLIYNGKTASYDIVVIAPEVVAISLKEPTKTSYQLNEKLSLDGGYIDIAYNYDVSEQYMPLRINLTDSRISVDTSKFNNRSAGVYTIKVAYCGFEKSFNVTVIAKVLQSITLSGSVKTLYKLNEAIDLSYASLTLVYNYGVNEKMMLNNSYEDLGISLSGFDNTTIGKKMVTITYLGKSTSFEIEIVAPIVTSIDVFAPTKTFYLLNETLSLVGGYIYLNYNYPVSDNVYPHTIQLTDNRVLINSSNFNNKKVGTYTIYVTYGNLTSSFTVIVAQKSIIGIEIGGDYKTEYNLGEQIDLTGMILIVKYDKSQPDNVNLSNNYQSLGVEIIGFNTNSTGQHSVSVKYQGKFAYFTIQVVAPTISAIQVTSPTKTTYRTNENLNLDGGYLTVTYNYEVDDIYLPHTIQLYSSGVEIDASNFNNKVEGSYTIVVRYANLSDSFTVRVVAPELVKISLTGDIKTEYCIGEPIDMNDAYLILEYTFGDNGSLPLKNYSSVGVVITGFNTSTVGNKTVTVKYSGKTTTYKINVYKKDQNEYILSFKVNGQAIDINKVNNIEIQQVNEKVVVEVETGYENILAFNGNVQNGVSHSGDLIYSCCGKKVGQSCTANSGGVHTGDVIWSCCHKDESEELCPNATRIKYTKEIDFKYYKQSGFELKVFVYNRAGYLSNDENCLVYSKNLKLITYSYLKSLSINGVVYNRQTNDVWATNTRTPVPVYSKLYLDARLDSGYTASIRHDNGSNISPNSVKRKNNFIIDINKNSSLVQSFFINVNFDELIFENVLDNITVKAYNSSNDVVKSGQYIYAGIINVPSSTSKIYVDLGRKSGDYTMNMYKSGKEVSPVNGNNYGYYSVDLGINTFTIELIGSDCRLLYDLVVMVGSGNYFAKEYISAIKAIDVELNYSQLEDKYILHVPKGVQIQKTDFTAIFEDAYNGYWIDVVDGSSNSYKQLNIYNTSNRIIHTAIIEIVEFGVASDDTDFLTLYMSTSEDSNILLINTLEFNNTYSQNINDCVEGAGIQFTMVGDFKRFTVVSNCIALSQKDDKNFNGFLVNNGTGNNFVEVNVTSQSGITRTYKINISFISVPYLTINVGNKTYELHNSDIINGQGDFDVVVDGSTTYYRVTVPKGSTTISNKRTTISFTTDAEIGYYATTSASGGLTTNSGNITVTLDSNNCCTIYVGYCANPNDSSERAKFYQNATKILIQFIV